MAPADRAPTAHRIRFLGAAAAGLASALMAAAGMRRPPWPCPRRNASSPRLVGLAGPAHRLLDADVGEHRGHGVVREPQRVRPGLGGAPGGQRDVQDQVPAVHQSPQPDSLGQVLGLRVNEAGPLERGEPVDLRDEVGRGHPVQDRVDADGEILGSVQAGLVEGGGLVRAGQAARDGRAALARHPGGGLVHLGHQPSLLPVALTRPDHRHHPPVTRSRGGPWPTAAPRHRGQVSGGGASRRASDVRTPERGRWGTWQGGDGSWAVGDEGFVPVADSPVPYYPVKDEGVAADELLGGLPGGEDPHRAVFLRVGERADHEQFAAVGELPPPGPVRGEVQGRLFRQVGGRLVEHHGFHDCPPVIAARHPRMRAQPSR